MHAESGAAESSVARHGLVSYKSGSLWTRPLQGFTQVYKIEFKQDFMVDGKPITVILEHLLFQKSLNEAQNPFIVTLPS